MGPWVTALFQLMYIHSHCLHLLTLWKHFTNLCWQVKVLHCSYYSFTTYSVILHCCSHSCPGLADGKLGEWSVLPKDTTAICTSQCRIWTPDLIMRRPTLHLSHCCALVVWNTETVFHISFTGRFANELSRAFIYLKCLSLTNADLNRPS